MKPVKRERIAGMGMHYKYRTLDYFLKSQKKLGVQSIEFWCARPHFLLDDYGFEDAGKLREKIDSYGMKLTAFLRNVLFIITICVLRIKRQQNIPWAILKRQWRRQSRREQKLWW